MTQFEQTVIERLAVLETQQASIGEEITALRREMREQMRITGLLPRVDQALTGAPNAAADVDALRLKGY